MTALMKKRILWIVYGAIALVCVIAFSVAAVWASQGALSTEITEILSAEVTIDTETQETPETTRTEYIVGEPLDTTGAAIRVTTKEGDVVTPSLEECTIEADMDTAGVKPVVIAWQQGTILYRGSYEIEVFAVRHLDVQPNDGDETLVYEQSATELDKTGIEVWADLSGSPDTMEKPNSEWSNVVRLTPEQFTLTSSEMGTPGIHNATIAAGRATASFTFAVEGISIDTSQAATYYGVGEEFFPAGINVTSTSRADITAENPFGTTYIGNYSFDPVDTSTPGDKAVKVSYGSVSAEYSVTVYPVAFHTENVTGTDGTSATMDFYWIKGATTANEGGFKVTWVDANGVRHKQQGTWGYYDGNNVTMWAYNGIIDTCNIYFNDNRTMWNWSDGPHGSGVSDGVNFEIYYPYARVSDVTLEIYGRAKLAELEAIKHGVDASSISVNTDGAKTVYEQGEMFSADGLVVTAQLWNGGTRVLSSSEYTVSAPSMNSVGPKTITVTYGNPTTGNPYEVLTVRYEVYVTGETLDVTGGKTVYYLGDTFSAAGVSLIRWGADGSQTDITPDFTLTEAPDMSTEGVKTVTLTSGDESYTYTIVVLPVSALEDSVLTFENRTGDGSSLALYIHERQSTTDAAAALASGYYVYTIPAEGSVMFSFGYTYDPEGWQSTFTSDESGLAASVLNDQASADNGALFVDYNGTRFAADQVSWHNVVMHWAHEAEYLEIDYSRATREYLVNGTFSAANLVVDLKFTDGIRQRLSEAEYTVSQPNMSVIAVHTVTVSYNADPSITGEYQIFTIPNVPWETHKIDFTQSAAGDRLELYVDERPDSSDSSQNSASHGWFLLKAADGHYEMYELNYTYTADGFASNFATDDGIGVSVGGSGELVASLGGVNYTVGATMWHQRLIGWAE